MDTPQGNELILAFECYDFIVTQTNPITGNLYTDKLVIPPYIGKRVKELETRSFSRFLDRRHPCKYLTSYSINQLLLELIRKDMPLYRVEGKEISCVSDIKSLWEKIKPGTDHLLMLSFDRERVCAVKAYLRPQYLKIEKGLVSNFKPGKQSKVDGIKKPNRLFYSWNEKDKLMLYSTEGRRVALTEQESKLILYLKEDRQTQDEIIGYIWEVYKPFDIKKKKTNLGEIRRRVNAKCREIAATDLISELTNGYYNLGVDIAEG